MQTTAGSLLHPRLWLDELRAYREERRRLRRRRWAELNMRRIDTDAFPMLREVTNPRNYSPSPEEDQCDAGTGERHPGLG